MRYADRSVFRVLRKVVEQLIRNRGGCNAFNASRQEVDAFGQIAEIVFRKGKVFLHERFKRFFVKKQHLAGGKRIDLGNSMRIRQEQARRAQQGPRGEHAHQHAPGSGGLVNLRFARNKHAEPAFCIPGKEHGRSCGKAFRIAARGGVFHKCRRESPEQRCCHRCLQVILPMHPFHRFLRLSYLRHV